ncbi:hypothetical protein THOM_0946 [Trachipleistophora hominis]|uniref:Uncharacterized protein n=1 Tax=Trachipleistophora hominis TaxID=72359 RepID=L7JX85_TRAHO|nr:hypothetical protein THOM_0946 [Trachipleistophora hominis]
MSSPGDLRKQSIKMGFDKFSVFRSLWSRNHRQSATYSEMNADSFSETSDLGCLSDPGTDIRTNDDIFSKPLSSDICRKQSSRKGHDNFPSSESTNSTDLRKWMFQCRKYNNIPQRPDAEKV